MESKQNPQTNSHPSTWVQRKISIGRIEAMTSMDSNTRSIIVFIIGKLNAKSGHMLAWPSKQAIAKHIKKSPETVKIHLRLIKKLGIFKHHSELTIQGAKDHLAKFNTKANFANCSISAPTIFEVNDHPLWHGKGALKKEVAEGMLKILDEATAASKQKRAARTKAKGKKATSTTELASREAELARKEAELARREAELASREAEVVRKEAELTRKQAELAAQEQPSPITARVKEKAESHAPAPAQEPVMSEPIENKEPVPRSSLFTDLNAKCKAEAECVKEVAESHVPAEKPRRPRSSRPSTSILFPAFVASSSDGLGATRSSGRISSLDRNSYCESDESDESNLSTTAKTVSYF